MRTIRGRIKEFLHQLCKEAECRDHQLLYLFLEITRVCNLACRHCGSDCSSKSSIGTLSTDSWIKILKDISKSFSPLPTIVLTGGEPVLQPDFQQIIRTLDNLGFQWGLVSNGYVLDENIVKNLVANNIHSITVSLDGMETSHNWLRNKHDAFVKTIAALRLLSQTSIPQKDVVTCVNPRNCEELDVVADLLIESGVRFWRLFRIFPAGRAKDNAQLLLTTFQTKKLLDWIAEKRELYIKRGLIINYSCEGWLPFPADVQIRSQPFFCRAGVNIGAILSDGTITGCTNNAERFFEGNVLKDSFPYIWQNGFKQFRDRSWVKSTECGSCSQISKCQGGSIHLWRENETRPEFCYYECVNSQASFCSLLNAQ